MLLNQDRCTKNFFTYLHPGTGQWMRFPWDLESAFGISAGLGGLPAPDYCIEVCEQWASPLYCDSDHPQDIPLAPGSPLLRGQLGGGPAPAVSPLGGARRRSLAQLADLSSTFTSANTRSASRSEALRLRGYTTSSGVELGSIRRPDVDMTGQSSVVGPDGTYNHLVDALLDIPVTREMYLRCGPGDPAPSASRCDAARPHTYPALPRPAGA